MVGVIAVILLLLVSATFIFAGWIPALVVCLALIILYVGSLVAKQIPKYRNYIILIMFVVIFFALFLAVKTGFEPEVVTNQLENYYAGKTGGFGLPAGDEEEIIYFCNDPYPIHSGCVDEYTNLSSSPEVETKWALSFNTTKFTSFYNGTKSKVKAIPTNIDDSIGSWSKTKNFLKPVGEGIVRWIKN